MIPGLKMADGVGHKLRNVNSLWNLEKAREQFPPGSERNTVHPLPSLDFSSVEFVRHFPYSELAPISKGKRE